MNYPQLISKYTMGAVLYHQACDNYLDEKMTASSKPNNKPYKKGAYIQVKNIAGMKLWILGAALTL